MKSHRLIPACAALMFSLAAHAQLTVEITGAGANRIPVAIANFAGDA
jgi:TolB protein